MITSLLYILFGSIFLLFGADWLVKSAVFFAQRLKISSLVIGLTVVAFGTSLPELVISVSAVLSDSGSIAIGNIIGSNIANVGLVLGLSSFIFPISIHFKKIKRDLYYYLIVSVIFILFLLDGTINKIEALILFSGIVIYIWSLIQFKRVIDLETYSPFKKIGTGIILFIAGILGLYYGSGMFVDGAVELAKIIGVSEMVIGLSVVALGTSLPELSTCIVASFKKQHAISVGNIIGSNLFNILSVVGIVGMIKPIVSSNEIFSLEIPVMMLFGLILVPLGLMKQPLSRLFSSILVIGYIAFIYVLFFN
jgi:cation:H+ antiporter